MVFTPKGDEEGDNGIERVRSAEATRPLSLKNTDNTIVCCVYNRKITSPSPARGTEANKVLSNKYDDTVQRRLDVTIETDLSILNAQTSIVDFESSWIVLTNLNWF